MTKGKSRLSVVFTRSTVLVLALSLWPSSALADTLWVLKAAAVAVIKWNSWKGDKTAGQERQLIRIICRQYEQKNTGFAIGDAMIGGVSLSNLPDGASTTLTFAFVDAETGNPVNVPGVAGVRYEIQTDPPSDPPAFEVLGSSTDPASGFALPYVVSGFEPLIIAIPLDASGEPFELLGAGGDDVSRGLAINIFLVPPIPTVSEWGLIILTLLGLTLGTIVFARRRGCAAV